MFKYIGALVMIAIFGYLLSLVFSADLLEIWIALIFGTLIGWMTA